MGFGNDVIQLKLALHEDIVLSFTVDVVAVNYWQRVEGVLNYGVHKRFRGLVRGLLG